MQRNGKRKSVDTSRKAVGERKHDKVQAKRAEQRAREAQATSRRGYPSGGSRIFGFG